MKHLIFAFVFTSSLFGQQVNYKVNGGRTNIYSDAIMHYIDSLHKIDNLAVDTLFILKNEEFTENILPGAIKNINISFQDTASVYRRLKYRKTLRAFNIFADEGLGKGRINITIVSFIISQENKGLPTKSCRFRYYYNDKKREFEFRNIACDY